MILGKRIRGQAAYAYVINYIRYLNATSQALISAYAHTVGELLCYESVLHRSLGFSLARLAGGSFQVFLHDSPDLIHFQLNSLKLFLG